MNIGEKLMVDYRHIPVRRPAEPAQTEPTRAAHDLARTPETAREPEREHAREPRAYSRS